MPSPSPAAWMVALGTQGALRSGYTAAVALAVVGLGSYLVLAVAMQNSLACATRALIAGLEALCLARLLWRQPHGGAATAVGAAVGAGTAPSPPPLRDFWTLRPVLANLRICLRQGRSQRRDVVFGLLVTGCCASALAAPGWAAAHEPGACCWALLSVLLGAACATASLRTSQQQQQHLEMLVGLSLSGTNAGHDVEKLEGQQQQQLGEGETAAPGAPGVSTQQHTGHGHAECCCACCPSWCSLCGASTYAVLLLCGAYHVRWRVVACPLVPSWHGDR
jgi:hypothetical protein